VKFPDWQPQFFAALLERDPRKLKEHAFSMEDAIVKRMESLDTSANADIEEQAIEEAIRALRIIQIEKLNYPDWKGRKIS
jgi:hypothetical protein